MKETILVTGSAGFLGTHITKALLAEGHTVIGVDNLIGGSKSNIQYIRDMGYGRDVFEMSLGDCANYRYMDDVFYAFKPTRVFHAACYPHEGLSINSPHLIAGNSVGLGSMAIASLACKYEVKRLVNCSSMARYGYQPTWPFDETMVPNPSDPYGAFKYAAEISMQKLCLTHGVEFVNLVPHNIYGEFQKYHDPFRNVAAIMINRAIQGKQPIIYGDGKQKRCFSYVGDLIAPILNSLFGDRPIGATINIGPSEPFIEINELALLVCDLAGMKFNPIYLPDRPAEVKHANCSNKKSKDLLGANYNTTIYEGLPKLFNWIKSIGPKPFLYHLPLEIVSENTPKTWTDRIMND